MRKFLKNILEVTCSGILGVILTLVVQFLFVKPQSFTFIYDGNEVVATESTYTELISENNDLKAQVYLLQAEMAGIQSELTTSQAKVIETQKLIDQQNTDDAINNFIQEIIKLWNRQEYVQVLTLLKNSFPNSEDVQLLYKTYSAQYCEMILRQVDSLIQDEIYDDAKNLVSEAAQIVYDDTELSNKLSELNDYLSTKLKDMKVVMSQFWYVEDEEHAKDSVGNSYSIENFYIMKANGINNYGYATFYLNNQYTELTGVIAVSDRSENIGDNQMEGYVEIYTKVNDEYKKLYTSPILSRMVSPFDISVDVTNCDWMEIRYYSCGDYREQNLNIYPTRSLYVLLSDFSLHSN